MDGVVCSREVGPGVLGQREGMWSGSSSGAEASSSLMLMGGLGGMAAGGHSSP